MKIIEIHSIRRSGHHAFVNWLVHNLLDTDGNKGYCPQKYNNINNKILWVNEAGLGLNETKQVITKLKPSYLFLTYEMSHYSEINKSDTYIKNNINSLILTPYLKEEWGVESSINFSFVREFWNNFASLYNLFPVYNDITTIKIVKKWIKYYKILLEHNLKTNGGLFDLWIQNENYANDLCKTLLNKKNKLTPLEITGTRSSYPSQKLTTKNLLNRGSKFKFPTWFIDLVYQDEKLLNLIDQQKLQL